MKTTATNRKVRELLTSVRNKTLIPRPEFQRRLVWSNKDKISFLETVLLNYPFPEIYVAAGKVDVETGDAQELLVDGQQRVTTLLQYFTGSTDLRLSQDVPAYSQLSNEEKEGFLQYDVVIRDLGAVPLDQIKEIFRRINATKYSLNAMEIHNARYEGAFKNFAERIAQARFFDDKRVFSASEIRRMQDTRFVLTLTVTLLSTYFNRDDEVEDYLKQFNDDFPLESDVEKELNGVFDFINELDFPPNSRAWKKADLFTLIVEVHRALSKDQMQLDGSEVSLRLKEFYRKVDNASAGNESKPNVLKYYKAALQATNDRGSRISRGEALREILTSN